jgi:hypothetical protein
MAQANTSSKQKRSAGSSNGSGAAKRKSASASKSNASAQRSSSASSRNRTSSSGGGGGDAQKRNGGGSKAAVVASLATGAAGLIGGAVLGSRLGNKPKKVLGIPVPGTGGGINGLAKQVGKAGKQLGQLTDEVRAAREKAEEVGKAIS